MRHIQQLNEMGIDVWVRRGQPAGRGPTVPGGGPDLAELARIVASCTRCDLHKSRTRTVFGVGDPNADLLIIGEAPGADEDRQGEPFVGRAGQLLNSMLGAIGVAREQAYIANILKCRPPGNRDPEAHEVAECASYLERQIELIAPKVILALGRVAAQNLLEVSTPIGKMRGRLYTYRNTDIPLVVTYHPAYLLRSPMEKRKAWQDLKLAEKVLEGQLL
jgi:DNA polymerase